MVKYSSTATWAKLDPVSPGWISAGKMRSPSFSGTSSRSRAEALAKAPFLFVDYKDLSSLGPGGIKFTYMTEENVQVGSVAFQLNSDHS